MVVDRKVSLTRRSTALVLTLTMTLDAAVTGQASTAAETATRAAKGNLMQKWLGVAFGQG